MKIEHRDGCLIVKDQPLGFWTFYSFFVVGGIVALVLSLSAAPDWTTTLIGSLIQKFRPQSIPMAVTFIALGSASGNRDLSLYRCSGIRPTRKAKT